MFNELVRLIFYFLAFFLIVEKHLNIIFNKNNNYIIKDFI